MRQDSTEDFKDILIERCRFLFAIVVMLMADAAFLVAWLGIHYALEKGLAWFDPVGYEQVAFVVLKIALETPVSIAVLAFVVSDSIKIVRRIFHGTTREIRREFQPINDHQPKAIRDNLP